VVLEHIRLQSALFKLSLDVPENYFLMLQTKLSPLELISGVHAPNSTRLQHLHVWGCDPFVFEPRSCF